MHWPTLMEVPSEENTKSGSKATWVEGTIYPFCASGHHSENLLQKWPQSNGRRSCGLMFLALRICYPL